MAASWVCAQDPNPTQTQPQEAPSEAHPQQPTEIDRGVPLYRIQVVARDIPAINYFHRSGSTKIGFRGTDLMPGAHGTAKVENKLGRTSISLDLEGLTPANGFGPEYLTYVIWAVTPEGRPVRIGEILPSGGKDRVNESVTTDLQAFGLIITAEPYYDVSIPSDVVVMQNVVEDRTQGVIEQVNAHYTLLPRGAYAETAGRHTVLHPITRNGRSPLELYEAENAVQIADAAGAEKYAADTMSTAKTALMNAEQADEHKKDRKMVITYAREAVQSAEDARLITIRKIKAEDEAAERQARQRAEEAAEQSKAQAEQARAQAEKDAAQRAQAEAAAEEAKTRAEQARAAREAAEQQAQQAQQQAQMAQQQAEQAKQQEAQMRERLKDQLNQVLQTRETARGLIVNMSDVLFDFNKYTLKPETREKLAKVSGILLAYPGLKMQVEGYTDNIGSDEYNQKLSEERADSVRDYLVAQGVQDNNISAQGYGKTHPIADNTTNSGRAQNRRVEMVVSGESIGVQESAPGSAGGTMPAGQNGPATGPVPATPQR
ncbi:OmpA family protein [Acidobacteria bacterium AB60]|nr:OmpA family protein [Acidobacteria bacterium AB60]